MDPFETILSKIEEEAHQAPFNVDVEAYRRARRDPRVPILVAGSQAAPVCMFARDLGVEEVLRGQPLIGSAGRRVRSAVFERMCAGKHADPPYWAAALKYVMLTNTVPYKPVGNVEFDRETKSRFRPFIEELLVSVWEGRIIIPMGEGAFKWFSPYGAPGEVVSFWDDKARRFTDELEVTLRATVNGREKTKSVILAPVPHPSPRSPFMKDFPALLNARLERYLPL